MADLTYWQKRHLKTKQKALKNAEKYEADYLKRLNKAHREIEKEIKAWAKKYATEDGGMTQANANKLLRGMDKQDWNNTLAQWEHKARVGGYDNELNLEYYRSRVSRLQALQGQITDIMATHTAPEVGRMQQQLADTYKDTYYRTTYNTQAQQMAINGNFARFNDDQLTKIVSKPWAGSDFSKRLWGNMTTKLPNELTKTLSRGVLLGHGVERMVKDARVTLNNASRYDLHRLITTEFAHITEQATLDSYHDSGIERYEYMATLETHTCERCGALDSEVIDTNKQQAGVNYPPLHPNCRCTTAPWFEELEEMDTDRWARDPEKGKGEVVANMSYDEWKKEVGVTKAEPVKSAKQSLFGGENPYKHVDKLNRDELAELLRNDLGMDISETSRTKVSELAMSQTLKTIGQFDGLYKALPQKIPTLEARTAKKSNGAVASYSRLFNQQTGMSKPYGLNVNVDYFKNTEALQEVVNRSVNAGWFSKNSDPNHIMIHEIGHHIDYQLSNMLREKGGNRNFSEVLFDRIKDKVTGFDDIGVSKYAASYAKQNNGKRTEAFAEYFAEAYGDTPRDQAEVFKKHMEQLAEEIINHANDA